MAMSAGENRRRPMARAIRRDARGILTLALVLPLVLPLVSLAPLLAACTREEGPEARVRAFVERVAASAEARAWGDFDGYVTDDYSDPQGLTRKEVLGILTRYILGHRSIHVFQRVRAIEVRDRRHARVVVLAALAGSPVAGPEDLARLAADLYRFELELIDDGGGFRVASAVWQPVGLEALLSGD